MKKRNGFTLVELLAVITVLGIVLVIASVSITSIMNDSKKKTAEATAHAIIRASSLYAFDNDYYESMSVLDSKLSYDGTKPASGNVQTNEDGDTKIAILIDGWCVTKDYDDADVTASKSDVCNMP